MILQVEHLAYLKCGIRQMKFDTITAKRRSIETAIKKVRCMCCNSITN